MLLLTIDALLFASVLVGSFLVVRSLFRKNNERKLEEALFRQQVAEELAKRSVKIDPEKAKRQEQELRDRLNGLQ